MKARSSSLARIALGSAAEIKLASMPSFAEVFMGFIRFRFKVSISVSGDCERGVEPCFLWRIYGRTLPRCPLDVQQRRVIPRCKRALQQRSRGQVIAASSKCADDVSGHTTQLRHRRLKTF